jgi:hypothetical protein
MVVSAAAMAVALPSLGDAQGHGRGHGKAHRGHAAQPAHPHGCPPGLANRRPHCVPPGQAQRLFREGQRISPEYRYYSGYDAIPARYRDRVPEGYRYIYRDDVVYVVDPTTRLVRSIIDLID